MKQGEIWEINLSPTIGAEIKKKRPAVIVSDDAIGILPLKVVVPITEWKDRFEGAVWLVKIDPDKDNSLKKVSALDTFQIRSVSTKRFLKQIGTISPEMLENVKESIKAVVDAG
ncbi:MAG: type II toxin-antitoxin system PemK/MazF family toxin [Deltaproteobacteria bacterium]|nr:type II toxin-antitoxin system PemK/MazF family toxin [Deltaproteobacteria bacterium]MBW1817494.1 type II toxin-antitoxin system PemK/MazF family toxin [Deltaproteobacteria bacterium]